LYPITLQELTACIYYKIAIDRGLRGCNPAEELLLHSNSAATATATATAAAIDDDRSGNNYEDCEGIDEDETFQREVL
jgi:hypothetical protein